MPGTLSRGRGQTLSVASFARLAAFGVINSYTIKKFAPVGLQEGPRPEVKWHGVGTTAFPTGLTGTTIIERVRFQGHNRVRIQRVLNGFMNSPGSVSAGRTGELKFEAVVKGIPLVVTALPGKALVQINRLFHPHLRRAHRRQKAWRAVFPPAANGG